MMLGLVIAVSSLLACATPPATAAPRVGTVVPVGFGRAWEGAITWFADSNYVLYQIERSSGYLSTPSLRLPGATFEQKYTTGHPLADCGSAGNPIMPDRVYYTVTVRGDSTRSVVKAAARFVHGANEYPCVSRGVWEERVEHEILKRALSFVAPEG